MGRRRLGISRTELPGYERFRTEKALEPRPDVDTRAGYLDGADEDFRSEQTARYSLSRRDRTGEGRSVSRHDYHDAIRNAGRNRCVYPALGLHRCRPIAAARSSLNGCWIPQSASTKTQSLARQPTRTKFAQPSIN